MDCQNEYPEDIHVEHQNQSRDSEDENIIIETYDDVTCKFLIPNIIIIIILN